MTSIIPATVPLNSTLLATATYHVNESLLELEFHTGATYVYHAVPEAIFQGLLATDSHGSYFNRQIRNHFLNQCVRRPR